MGDIWAGLCVRRMQGFVLWRVAASPLSTPRTLTPRRHRTSSGTMPNNAPTPSPPSPTLPYPSPSVFIRSASFLLRSATFSKANPTLPIAFSAPCLCLRVLCRVVRPLAPGSTPSPSNSGAFFRSTELPRLCLHGGEGPMSIGRAVVVLWYQPPSPRAGSPQPPMLAGYNLHVVLSHASKDVRRRNPDAIAVS